MGGRADAGRIDETSVRPGYLLSGEDHFRAGEFVRRLRRSLPGPDGQPATARTFLLSEARWNDILDEARTIPFFFSPWQVLVAEGSGAKDAELEDAEKKLLQEYFRSPTPRTVLAVLFEGKIAKNRALYRFLSGLPEQAVEVIEFEPLKGAALVAWIEEKLRALGKAATREAIDVLVEAAGNDLGRLENEIEKLSAFVGEKGRIERSDAEQLVAGDRDFEFWALADSLDRMDVRESFRVIRKLFMDESAEAAELMLLGQLSAYLRDILAAREMVREGRDRREIFRELRPGVPPGWREVYELRFGALFGAVDLIPRRDFDRLIRRLSEIDRLKKTTESSIRPMLEALIAEYAEIRRKGRLTSQPRS